MPTVILHIGEISFPVVHAVISEKLNLVTTASVEIPLSQFLAAGPVILSEEARITIDGEPRFTGLVDAVRPTDHRLRLDLAGAAIRLKEVRIGAQWGGFPNQELMYLLLRSSGWPADRIEGLPVDNELRWFDSIFLLQGVYVAKDLHWQGSRIYRLSTASDPHERYLLNSALGHHFSGRTVARVKVVANEWAQAREKTLERAITLLSWVDFTAAIPIAFTPAGASLLGWKRRHSQAKFRLGLWQSLFDLRYVRHWVSRPEFQQVRALRLGKRRGRRVSTMDPLYKILGPFAHLQEAVRWLYFGRQATSNLDRLLNEWYALEFSIGSETLEDAFSDIDKAAINSALRTVQNLNQRQSAILSRLVSNLNAPTFRARLNSALKRAGLTLNDSQLKYIAQAQELRNSTLHGAKPAAIDPRLTEGFDAVVRLIIVALLEAELRAERALASPTQRNTSVSRLLSELTS